MNNKKEIFLYLFFGLLTTFISILSFYIFTNIFHIHELISNILSWLIAMSFAYYTNSIYVFKYDNNSKQTIIKFFSARLLSLGIEELIILIFVTLLHYREMFIKLIAQIIVIILNYIFSKWFVFK